MARGVRWYLIGLGGFGVLGVLAGCSGGGFFAQREAWRHEAEVQCLNSGAVKEAAGIVRIKAISGPGMCGADFPLRVSMLGESAALGYSDDPRPPGAIPNGSAPSRWPIRAGELPPPPRSNDQPVSLDPPSGSERSGSASEPYDFRKPYGSATPTPTPRYRPPRDGSVGSPREDFSPEPYDRRPLVDAPPGVLRGGPSSVSRVPLNDPPLVGTPRVRAPASIETSRPREPPPPVVPLGPARGAQVTGAITPVAVTPAATLACPIVSELDRWIVNVVQPAALHWFGSPVAEIKQISAYSCRGMNGDPNAKISEHAFGNALDIASFTLADGRTITVKNGWRGLPEEQGFLHDVQGAACQQFTTVLAPGSNVYHYDHIHVDLMNRRNGYRVCNPHAVSGEEIAARAGARYAARRAGEASVTVTGSLTPRRLPSPPKRLRSSDDDMRFDQALPMAEPGNDGED
jgi:extensin-like protein